MVIYHIDVVIRDIVMGCGQMICEMTIRYGHPPYRSRVSYHSARQMAPFTSSIRIENPRSLILMASHDDVPNIIWQALC